MENNLLGSCLGGKNQFNCFQLSIELAMTLVITFVLEKTNREAKKCVTTKVTKSQSWSKQTMIRMRCCVHAPPPRRPSWRAVEQRETGLPGADHHNNRNATATSEEGPWRRFHEIMEAQKCSCVASTEKLKHYSLDTVSQNDSTTRLPLGF